MERLFAELRRHADERPDHAALVDATHVITYRELWLALRLAAAAIDGQRVGLLLGNGCAWALLDLALLSHAAVCVPMPAFFSDAQLRHLIDDAGLDSIITDEPLRIAQLIGAAEGRVLEVAGRSLTCHALRPLHVPALPPATAKLTYTSGTTGHPKGVCLTAAHIERVAIALSEAVDAGPGDRACTLLPLSTLLANIGGLYAPLYSGGTAWLPDLAEGMSGSTDLRSASLLAMLQRVRPTVTIVVPQLLKALVDGVASGAPVPTSLRFIAVGGAPTAPALLARARALGLPVYQGYGLSEAGSVVSLNLPGQRRLGSVGRPLPHVKVRIAQDGEVMVSGHLFSGYLDDANRPAAELATGDLGFINPDGYLYITCRKKTSYATALGRNLAPEWIERALTADPVIAQAAVFGAGRPFNIAVIVPSSAAALAEIGAAIGAANASLPDYARVARWISASQAFSYRNGLADGAGALRREAIAQRYSARIEQLYAEENPYAVL